MPERQPYLSFVVASRDDDYAGGMLRRLQVCTGAFLAQAERFSLPSELIVVDWNPPAGKPLWNRIRWPSVLRHCVVRVITVPPRIHAIVPFARRLPILIARARNVGIRRACGRFVLPTSPDILLSNELVEWLAGEELDPMGMYRIARHDVPEKALEYNSHEKRLIYCRAHVRRAHERGPSQRINGLPDLFTNAAGDFTLLSRDMYFTLHGVPEEREFHSMHFDSVFCYMAHAAGAREVELMDPLRIYHVDHGVPSWRPSISRLEQTMGRLPVRGRMRKRLMKLVRKIAPPKSAMERLGVPHLDLSTFAGQAQYTQLITRLAGRPDAFRYNDADWGLSGYSLEERVFGSDSSEVATR